MSEERSLEEEIRVRRAAREKVAEAYPARARRTHTAAAAREAMGARVAVAGRLRSRRGHGKMVFGDLEDASGRIQIQFRADALGDSFALLDPLMLGDFLEAEGEVFTTKTGEPTVAVAAWRLLAKALRPIPKWHGLEASRRIEDPEIRYRKRYLDLASDPAARARFVGRAAIVGALRDFFRTEGFLEVETPMLQPIPGGAVARPFVTRHNALDEEFYLRIAPELYLKRLLVGGFDRVFEIGKCFRNEGIDRMHNPEFTMLEAYAAYGDYATMADLFERAVAAASRAATGGTRVKIPDGFLGAGRGIELAPPWRRIPYLEAIAAHGGPRLGPDDDPEKIEAAFETHAEPNLVEPTIVVDFPVSLSPLAKRSSENPNLAERFEPFVGGKELGNAFSELNDPDDQRARFEEQIRRERAAPPNKRGEVAPVLDEDYLEALETGMPPAGGLGIGVDRLAMLLLGVDTIREIVLFPTLRHKRGPAS